jgi:hypothetical protein
MQNSCSGIDWQSWQQLLSSKAVSAIEKGSIHYRKNIWVILLKSMAPLEKCFAVVIVANISILPLAFWNESSFISLKKVMWTHLNW